MVVISAKNYYFDKNDVESMFFKHFWYNQWIGSISWMFQHSFQYVLACQSVPKHLNKGVRELSGARVIQFASYPDFTVVYKIKLFRITIFFWIHWEYCP